MDRRQIRRALQGNNAEKQFITITELAAVFGAKQTKTVKKYVSGLDVVSGKYYLINDVTQKILEQIGGNT